MKKSTIYHIAQMSVMEGSDLTTDEKLEILSVLMEDERLAKFQEEQEEQEEQE